MIFGLMSYEENDKNQIFVGITNIKKICKKALKFCDKDNILKFLESNTLNVLTEQIDNLLHPLKDILSTTQIIHFRPYFDKQYKINSENNKYIQQLLDKIRNINNLISKLNYLKMLINTPLSQILKKLEFISNNLRVPNDIKECSPIVYDFEPITFDFFRKLYFFNTNETDIHNEEIKRLFNKVLVG
jgi:hypothetical protein